MVEIEDVEQLEVFLAENPDSVILKHSTACSISARAYQEFSAFVSSSPLPAAIVLVIEARSVSNHLAQASGVVHQSPQVLFFRDGKCYRSLSHYSITAESLQAMLNPNNSGFVAS